MLPCLLIGTKRSSLCRTRTARESARPFVRRNSIRTRDSDRVGRQPDTDAIRGRIAASSASIARHRGDGRAAKPPTAMQIFSLRECPIPAGISPSPGLLVSVASSHNPAEPAPNAAAAMQGVTRRKYGEMSTLGNYVFQSFNLRSKSAQHCSCSIACSNAGRGRRSFGRRSRGPDAPAPLIASDYGGALVKLLLGTGSDAGASGPSHGYCRMGASPRALASFRRDGTEPTGGPSVFYSRSEPHWGKWHRNVSKI